jgi:hypothetical protein
MSGITLIKSGLLCATIAAALAATPCSAQSGTDDAGAAQVVGDQVRSQGYRCDQPATATQDVKLSKPLATVWTLRCRNVTYRIRLDPDMAAHVKRLRRRAH